jgi:hypothetical protein
MNQARVFHPNFRRPIHHGLHGSHGLREMNWSELTLDFLFTFQVIVADSTRRSESVSSVISVV